MKRLIIVPLVFMLSGCPGEGKPMPERRSVFMQDDVICFTVNKNDVLDYYSIYYWPNKKYTVVKASDGIHLTYPETCVKVKLDHGYEYNISYGLNGKYYSDSFFLDNDGNY